MLGNLNIKNSKALQFLCFLFTFFLIWRVVLFLYPNQISDEFNMWSFVWGASYQSIAFFGAVTGFMVSRHWGGWNSTVGRAILAFSFGLFFQSVGQTIASYYVFTIGDIPYPGLDDIGFFGSVISYIYGVFLLAKLAGVKFLSFNSMSEKLKALLIPITLLIFTYLVFLQGYEFDWTNKIRIFLDFSYPLGQAFYIAVAIAVYFLSTKGLGGIMRKPIVFIIISLIIQYIADFTFLYQATNGLYIPEGVNDFMYFISYFFMALSLTQLGVVFHKIRES